MVPRPGRPDSVIDGLDAMRAKVRELVRAGAEVIKVCTTGCVLSPRDDPRRPQFSPAELAACVEEADAVGIPVMAHAQGKPGIMNALRAGVSSIEHGIYADDECFELMIDRGVYLVPTLLAPVALIQAIDAGARQPAAVEAKARAAVEIHRETTRAAVAVGERADLNVVTSDLFDVATHAERLTYVFKAGKLVRELEPGKLNPPPPVSRCPSPAASLGGAFVRSSLDGDGLELAHVRGDRLFHRQSLHA